jgi:nitroreductase
MESKEKHGRMVCVREFGEGERTDVTVKEQSKAGLSAVEVHALKKAPAVEGVLPVFHERWSPRSFADREVSAETLKKVFEAARWAASSFNEQPWRFLVGRRGDSAYKKIFESLGEFNQKWAQTAPVLMLGAAKTKFSHNGVPNRVALYDLGAAASYMTLQAAALGLKTHQMAGFDPEKAKKLFGIPEEYLMGAAIALGYQGEPEILGDEGMIKQETSPRTRKPLGEFVFKEWGEAAEL